jgi:hypothetical protein
VIEWRRTATGWRARVVYALGDGDHAATVETWVQAQRLCPASQQANKIEQRVVSRGVVQRNRPALQICRGDLSYIKTSLQTSDRSRLAEVQVSRLGASAARPATPISPALPIRPTAARLLIFY